MGEGVAGGIGVVVVGSVVWALMSCRWRCCGWCCCWSWRC